MNYNDIGLYEFFVKLTYDESFRLSDSEMYSYIKLKTDNFDLETFNLFRKELNFLSGSIKFVPPPQITNNKDVEVSILEFHKEYIVEPGFKYIKNNKNQNEYIKKLAKYVDLFINEFDAKMKMIEIQQYYKEYNFGLFERYSQIIRFSDLLFSIYERIFPEQPKLIKIHQFKIKNKQPLIFAGLFKPEFRSKLDILFERLKLNGYIDENKNWIIKNSTNEPAKLFHYLKDKNVIIAPKFKPAIECFYNEFGCEVVEKHNGNPRATTRVNAQEAKNSVDESAFNLFVLSWVNKK